MTEKSQQNELLENPDVAFEQSDLNLNRMALWGGIVLIIILCAMVQVFFLMGGLASYRTSAEPTPLPLLELRPTPPSPRLQPNTVDQQTAEQDLANFRAREEQTLNSYGWVNREAGLVRIPIDRAMELVAEDAVPTAEPAK